MATVTFSTRSSNSNKLSSIYLRFKDSDRIDIKLSVDYLFCSPSNFRKGKCKTSTYKVKDSDPDTLNVTLEKLRKHTIDCFEEKKHDIRDSKLWLKQTIDDFNKKTEKKDLDDFVIFLDYFLASKKESVQASTYKKLKTEVKKYKEFISENSDFFDAGQIIRFSSIDEHFLEKFEYHLENSDYQADTYIKKVRILKEICGYAKQKRINVNDTIFYWQFKKFKKSNDAKFIYLNFDELKSISELDTLPNYLDNARDWLLISCYTGQRVSDFLDFTKDNVTESSEHNFIEFTQKKTMKQMRIPILKQVQTILNKRNGDFPRKISTVNYNLYIKKVCEQAGITNDIFGGKTNQGSKNRKIYDTYPKHKLVTSHIGRRSFATNYYGNLDINTLMYVTGHSSQKQFLDYIQKTNEERGLEVAKAFKKIEDGI